jgi:hypothetical protein
MRFRTHGNAIRADGVHAVHGVMSANYRVIARQALQRAKSELASGDPERLKYAALELRGAMEAVTYNRVQLYKGEIPAALYRKWQPRDYIRFMVEIDWMASYRSWEVSFKPRHEPGKPENAWIQLGTETLLTMKDLSYHYNALGNFLHIPTPYQVENDKEPEKNSIKERCEKCVKILDKVLKSPISNAHIKISSETKCFRCGLPMIRRFELNQTATVEASCIGCGAQYVVSHEGPNTVRWTPKIHEIECRTPGCDKIKELWEDEIRPDLSWDCEGCGEGYALQLRLMQKIKTDN